MSHKSVFLDIFFECHSVKLKFLYNKSFFYKNLLAYIKLIENYLN